jgi:hypothetical protein
MSEGLIATLGIPAAPMPWQARQGPRQAGDQNGPAQTQAADHQAEPEDEADPASRPASNEASKQESSQQDGSRWLLPCLNLSSSTTALAGMMHPQD